MIVKILVYDRSWHQFADPERALSGAPAYFPAHAKTRHVNERLITLIKDEGKAMWTKAFQDLTAAIDSFRMCIFTSFAPVDSNDYAALIMAATGMAIDGNEVMKIGERI